MTLVLFLIGILALTPGYEPKLDFSFVKDCGVGIRYTHRQPRLINGKQSVRGAWPWQVSLQVLHPQLGLMPHWCGGVLIHPSWVLTAAHCIHNDIFSLPIPELWTAVLGDWDRLEEERTEVRVPVEKIRVHEKFHEYQHDIALLKLSRPISSSRDKGIRSVCLPESEPHYTHRCIATGWGRNQSSGDLSNTLRQIVVPLHNISLCTEKYGPSVTLHGGHLCGGSLDGLSGACIVTWTYLQTSRLASLGLLEIPRHRTRIYDDSYHISVARLWNSLRRDIRESQSLGSFKTSLVKFLKESKIELN